LDFITCLSLTNTVTNAAQLLCKDEAMVVVKEILRAFVPQEQISHLSYSRNLFPEALSGQWVGFILV
jgi:hypothetical protein